MKRYLRTNTSNIQADWAEDLHNDLKDVDTSKWSKMMSDKYEDDIRDAGGYAEYIKKEKVLSSIDDPYTDEQKQYVYRCVAESPALPDFDVPEEEWSVYHRDFKEYKDWAFFDAVEDGLFNEDEYDKFEQLWNKAETDMAAPYA